MFNLSKGGMIYILQLPLGKTGNQMKINCRAIFLLLIGAVFFTIGCKTIPSPEGSPPSGTSEKPVEGGEIEKPQPPEKDPYLEVEESLLEGDTESALETLDA